MVVLGELTWGGQVWGMKKGFVGLLRGGVNQY